MVPKLVAAHDVADDRRTLPKTGPRAHAGFEHCVHDPALHRLQAISNVGESPGHDDRHRIIEKRLLDLVVDIDDEVVLFVGSFVDHVALSLSDVEEPDVLGIALDEVFAGGDVVSHQRRDDLLRQRRVLQFDLDEISRSSEAFISPRPLKRLTSSFLPFSSSRS